MSDGDNGEEEGEGGMGDGDEGGGRQRGRWPQDSKRHAVSGNGRWTAAAMEKERAGAAAEPSIVFCLD